MSGNDSDNGGSRLGNVLDALLEDTARRALPDVLDDAFDALMTVLVEHEHGLDDGWAERAYVVAAQALAVVLWVKLFVNPECFPSPSPDPDLELLRRMLNPDPDD